MKITLTTNEMEELLKHDPASASAGGFQNFMVQLGARLNRATGELDLTDQDVERLDRYANDYGGGGFQNRIATIFGRTVGPTRNWAAR